MVQSIIYTLILSNYRSTGLQFTQYLKHAAWLQILKYILCILHFMSIVLYLFLCFKFL